MNTAPARYDTASAQSEPLLHKIGLDLLCILAISYCIRIAIAISLGLFTSFVKRMLKKCRTGAYIGSIRMRRATPRPNAMRIP